MKDQALHHCFQATFSTLQWTAAFAGFSGSDYGTGLVNNVIPIVLIGWNTFCARILFGVALPVLLLAPFTLWLRYCHLQGEQ